MHPTLRKTAHYTLALLLTVLVAGWAVAESSPDAEAWLTKVAQLYEKGPFSVNYSAEMNVTQQGQSMSMNMEGQMTQADPKHMRMKMSMDMAMPNSDQTMTMDMLTVVDGETVWIEMNNPMAGGQRVMKMPYEQAEQMGGGPGMSNIREMDPVEQIKEVMELFDFQIVEEGDRVVLSAPMTEAALSEMGQMGDMPSEMIESWKMTLVLDASKGLPMEMQIGGEGEPVMSMRFTDWVFHGEGGLDDSAFDYTPPEGVQVMDLSQMSQGMPPGGGGN